MLLRSPRHSSPRPARSTPRKVRAASFDRLRLLVLIAGLLGLLGCSPPDDAATGAGGRPPTPVVVSSPFGFEFADRVEALGTATANESIVVTAQVTETVRRVYFEDGQIVEQGAILVDLDRTEEIAQLAGARAERADARLRFERVADLAKSGTESRSRFDEVRTALDAAEARVAELEARAADRRIRAPFSGVLGLREVSPGTLVQPGDPITTLDDIDLIKLDFSVPETFFSILQVGLDVETSSAAYPGRAFPGRIAAVDSRVDPDTRAIRVRAEIPNADHAIRPGMLMTLVLRINPQQSLAIVEQALVPHGPNQFVVVLSEDDQPRRVQIRIGRRVPGIVEVLSGLEPDDRIVIDGASLIQPGSVVTIVREEAPPSV